MPKWVNFGQRRQDYGLMIDFHKHRAIVRANTALVDSVELELIPFGFSGYAPGMILIHRDWQDIYAVIEREGWEEDQYFEYAHKKFAENKIKKP